MNRCYIEFPFSLNDTVYTYSGIFYKNICKNFRCVKARVIGVGIEKGIKYALLQEIDKYYVNEYERKENFIFNTEEEVINYVKNNFIFKE